MEIRFGDWIFEADGVEEHRISFSRLTLEQLHFFDIKIDVDNDETEKFEQVLEEYKDGDVIISDEAYAIVQKNFRATIKGYSINSISNCKSYSIGLSECSAKTLKGIIFQGQSFEQCEISQEVSNNAIIINAKIVVTSFQFKLINQLKSSDLKYFPVIRIGIDQEPLQMRFGRTLWSEKNGTIRMSLILVEEEYDKEEDKFHGFAEPELSNAIKQIEQLKVQNMRLLNILQEKNLITKEQREEIGKEVTIEERKKEYYQYERVNDIDEWE